MTFRYRVNDIQVLPEDLVAFAWSAPMRDLASRVGMSDVGLRKILKGLGVFLPPQGHWNRVHAGRTVPGPPGAPDRRAGETGRLRIDSRFAPFIDEARPIPASGPFASREVPEDLEELRSRELEALGKVKVPATLAAHHPGFADIIRTEDRRRQKAADSSWHWDAPRFDSPVDQRRLRLFNGLLHALAKRGHGGDASASEIDISLRIRIGDTWLGLSIEIAGKHSTVVRQGHRRPDPALPAGTPMIIRLRPGFDSAVKESWQDEPGCKLETRIAEIAASLIAAGEAKFRNQLQDDEDRAERRRIEQKRKAEEDRLEQERRRIEKIRLLNEKRVSDLHRSGELLRLSRDLRALVAEVREAMRDRPDIADENMDAWERWALAEADRLDPVLSGQVFAHLLPPDPPRPTSQILSEGETLTARR